MYLPIGRRDVACATTLWKDESRYYNIYKDECEEGEECGHYKQVHMNNMLHLLMLHFVNIVKHSCVLYALIQNNTHSVCYIHISA